MGRFDGDLSADVRTFCTGFRNSGLVCSSNQRHQPALRQLVAASVSGHSFAISRRPSVRRLRPRIASDMQRSKPTSEPSRLRFKPLPLCSALIRHPSDSVELSESLCRQSSGRLLHSGLRQTQIRNHIRQLFLIRWRMKTTVE